MFAKSLKSVTYTNHDLAQEVKVTTVPMKGQTISGYGGNIPTQYMVKYNGYWHRVKVMTYGNSGSPYIESHGGILFLDVTTESYLSRIDSIVYPQSTIRHFVDELAWKV